jgi:hypothetical protein
VSEQQRLAASAKSQQVRRRRARSARLAADAGDGVAEAERSSGPEQGPAVDWQALEEALCHDSLLWELSEAAAAAGGSDRGAAALFAVADGAARRWLAGTLSRLPCGAAAVSLSEGADPVSGNPCLLVCRLGPLGDDGRLPAPLVAALPAPEAGHAM